MALQVRNYHLMDHLSSFYPNSQQRLCHNMTHWNASDTACCTIDSIEYHLYAQEQRPYIVLSAVDDTHVIPQTAVKQSPDELNFKLEEISVTPDANFMHEERVKDLLILDVGYNRVDLSHFSDINVESIDNNIPFSYILPAMLQRPSNDDIYYFALN